MDVQTGPSPAVGARDAAARFLWIRYRRWSESARKLQAQISRTRAIILYLTIVGAVLGMLCQQAKGWVEAKQIVEPWLWLPTAAGWMSAAALGLVAFFTREILNQERQRRWVHARAAAERYKSQTYLLRTRAAPYDKDDASSDELLETAKELGESLGPPPPSVKKEDELLRNLPGPMSINDYIRKRVEDQIEYYDMRAAQYSKKLNRGWTISLALGILAVVLGVLGGAYGWTAGWIAVVSTVLASLAANQYANRYEYLIVSYQITSERLKWLKTRWDTSGQTETDTEARHRFILDCEQAMASENSSWMAEWSKKTEPST